jgi:hypothetical protein
MFGSRIVKTVTPGNTIAFDLSILIAGKNVAGSYAFGADPSQIYPVKWGGMRRTSDIGKK